MELGIHRGHPSVMHKGFSLMVSTLSGSPPPPRLLFFQHASMQINSTLSQTRHNKCRGLWHLGAHPARSTDSLQSPDSVATSLLSNLTAVRSFPKPAKRPSLPDDDLICACGAWMPHSRACMCFHTGALAVHKCCVIRFYAGLPAKSRALSSGSNCTLWNIHVMSLLAPAARLLNLSRKHISLDVSAGPGSHNSFQSSPF